MQDTFTLNSCGYFSALTMADFFSASRTASGSLQLYVQLHNITVSTKRMRIKITSVVHTHIRVVAAQKCILGTVTEDSNIQGAIDAQSD